MKSHGLLASFLIAAASLAPSGAFAEGNCPDGYYPNPAGCAPAGVPTDGYRDYKNQIQREKKEHQEAVDKEYKYSSKSYPVF